MWNKSDSEGKYPMFFFTYAKPRILIKGMKVGKDSLVGRVRMGDMI